MLWNPIGYQRFINKLINFNLEHPRLIRNVVSINFSESKWFQPLAQRSIHFTRSRRTIVNNRTIAGTIDCVIANAIKDVIQSGAPCISKSTVILLKKVRHRQELCKKRHTNEIYIELSFLLSEKSPFIIMRANTALIQFPL